MKRKNDEILSFRDELHLLWRSMGLFSLRVPKNLWYVFNIGEILFILGVQWLLFGFGTVLFSLLLLFTCFAWFCTYMRDK